jgi:membrane protein DedA with SNARE-associated domain
MDFLPDINTLTLWLAQYGSIALFVLLTLGIIILPVPEETMMVIAGVLMHNKTLQIFPTVLAALLGSICGISISYLLGRTAGSFLVLKYGKWIGLTEKRYRKAHNWFERFGKWTLPIGYFVPGVRHFTGFVAGTTKLHYKQFALFAYCGAALWVSTFLSIGYFFGNHWMALYEEIEFSLDVVAIVAVGIGLIVALVLIRKFRHKLFTL